MIETICSVFVVLVSVYWFGLFIFDCGRTAFAEEVITTKGKATIKIVNGKAFIISSADTWFEDPKGENK